MHKFVRGEEPVDLEAQRLRHHSSWDSFAGTAEHAQLGDALYERQEHYCAYCETRIPRKTDGHIEHLARRSDCPARAFDWLNLFFSCNHEDSCGKYKDHCKLRFEPSNIVDPSREEPLDFFAYDANGGIFARDEEHKARAEETIRIFHLNQSPRLNHLRAQAARTAVEFLESDPEEAEITAFLHALPVGCDCISVYYSLCDRKTER